MGGSNARSVPCPSERKQVSVNPNDLKRLAAPFAPMDIEWRIGRSGVKDDKPWATCLAYITNRAIMERLDEVCGAGNWRNEYKAMPIGANDSTILCGISVKIGDEWVTKW